MTNTVWTPPRSYISRNFDDLLDRLVAKHALQEVDAQSWQVFLDAPGDGVALFTDDPEKTPESWDLAVIFPDLVAAAGTPLRAAVLRPAAARALQGFYGINRLPALLFVRDGGYVGAVEGLRDWAEYVAECQALLHKPVGRAPAVGIAVASATTSSCH